MVIHNSVIISYIGEFHKEEFQLPIQHIEGYKNKYSSQYFNALDNTAITWLF